MKTTSPSSIDVIEMHKENINPLSGGRSITKLTETIKNSNKNEYFQTKSRLQEEKDQFELKLQSIDELDDPLQLYLDYIDWTHRNFPQGANSDSNLINLLERCTSNFRDINQYKNDSRYIKVWLEYTKYCDTPRDVYVYLAKKEIGNQSALFYEEFAQHLEVSGKYVDANQIYELGIQNKAFPLARLQRSYDSFKKRWELQENEMSSSRGEMGNVLALKRGSALQSIDKELPLKKKSRVDIYQDNSDTGQSVISSIFGNNQGQNLDLESKKERIKENIIIPTQWNGQVLKQKGLIRHSSSDKVQIFCDQSSPNFNQPNADYQSSSQIDEKNLVYTLVQMPNKRAEKIMINSELLYPNDHEENSMLEVLVRQKFYLKSSKQKLHPVIKDSDKNAEMTVLEETKSFAIPINDDTISSKPTNDPTVTSFSKLAKNEVLGMFNSVLHENEDLHDSDEEKMNDATLTNFDGFVTETLHSTKQISKVNKHHGMQQIGIPNRSGGKVSNYHASSGFSTGVHEAKSDSSINLTYPLTLEMQESIIDSLSIPITTYPGYINNSSLVNNKLKGLKEMIRNTQRLIKGTRSTLIDYLGEEVYSIIEVMNEDDDTYLVESGLGNLKLLKLMEPTSRWEFYIIHRIHRKLLGKPELSKFYIKSDVLHYFKDESFLLLDHTCHRKSLSMVIKSIRTKYGKINELFCIFIAIELLKAIKSLHDIDIVHGNLKLENILINFELEDNRLWSSQISNFEQNFWDKKNIILFNFKDALDFGEVRKASNRNMVKVNGFDENLLFMNDYKSVFNILHSLVYGDEVSSKTDSIQFIAGNLWRQLFETLKRDDDIPNLNLMHSTRDELEKCLKEHSRSETLKAFIKEFESIWI
ncbi:BUB1 [Candida pseudojiufengensis]|uniref:BUB1 n=1 Tax=Candida pseudojiufengensis TaxID=497109 RepID=UPI0022257C58|nr:BUB1 [Candida pseudojiufengensis]KAI5965574.1 BUB1 [Candida pseudojiufengensis]